MTRKHFRELVDIITDTNMNREQMQQLMSFCMRHNRRFCERAFLDALEDKGWNNWGNLRIT